MKQRKTSLELLRIISICLVIICHLYIYNGVFYQEFTPNSIISLFICAGNSVPCDYIFIGTSSYFLIKKKDEWHPKRLLTFVALVGTLWVLKMSILRGLFGFNNTEYFVDLFLVNGAWWYALQYSLMLLYYPLLNKLIYREKPGLLYLCTAALFVPYIMNGVTNDMNDFNDLIMFVFTYLVMGCLYVHPPKWNFFTKHKKPILIALALICSLAMLISCVYTKLPISGIELKAGNDFIWHIIGRYCFPALIVGLCVFELFREWDIPHSNMVFKLSKLTIYVFLLHETTMGIFWYFKKCWNTLNYDPIPEFLFWSVMYIIGCFAFAALVHQIYTRLFEPLWNKIIDKLCTLYTERKSSC